MLRRLGDSYTAMLRWGVGKKGKRKEGKGGEEEEEKKREEFVFFVL